MSLWSEEGLQRELKKSVQNDLAYARISRELAERGYIHTVEQCRAKVKSPKAKASARALIHKIVEGQEKSKRRREELEELRLKQEEKSAAEERERDRALSTSMTEMMKMMTQYMAQQSAAFFHLFPWELSNQDHHSKYFLTPCDIRQYPMHMDHLSVDYPQVPHLHHMGVLAQVRRKTNQQCLAATL